MAALTHVQCMTAFEHITHTVMDQDDGSPLLKALANAGANDALIGLSKQQIDALEYNDGGTTKLLEPGNKNPVTLFVAYVCHRIRIGTPIGTDYLSVTQDKFFDYLVNDSMTPMADAPSNPEMNDPVADFLEGI